MSDNVDENGNLRKPKPGHIWRIPTQIYSRVVGYLRPVQDWHTAKQQEFDDRREFVVDDMGDEDGET